jgi:hypothetical protein
MRETVVKKLSFLSIGRLLHTMGGLVLLSVLPSDRPSYWQDQTARREQRRTKVKSEPQIPAPTGVARPLRQSTNVQ